MFKESEDEFRAISKILEDKKDYLPLKKDLFNAFRRTPLDKVKVVIVGQIHIINN